MSTTDERMLEALSRAMKFEEDGVAYYNTAMMAASSNLALDVLRTLRDEEVKHKEMILKIYNDVKGGGGWPAGEAPGAPMPDFVSVFRQLGDDPPKSASEGELAALKHALEVEVSGRGMYDELAANAPSAPEKKFYELLSGEEQKHIRIIEDSIEYFEDPDGWFQKHEHSGLDGA
jgi:rubrerythrin